MHREISHTDEVFGESSNAGLYLLTALLAILLALDLWTPLASWLTSLNLGIEWPIWQREFSGYRYALIAAVLGGARVLFNSLEALFDGKLGADLAIAVACIAAILIGEPLVAAEVVFIGLIGECLEAFTFARSQRGIRKLVEVFPRKCWLLRNGQEIAVNTDEVRVGDRVVVKPGKKVPVDGVVVEGRSAVDASPLTGESLPIDKEPGNDVLAGSINQFGLMIVEAKKVAEQTVAGRVIELTSKALKDKAPIQRGGRSARKILSPGSVGAGISQFLDQCDLSGRAISTRIEPAQLVRCRPAQHVSYPGRTRRCLPMRSGAGNAGSGHCCARQACGNRCAHQRRQRPRTARDGEDFCFRQNRNFNRGSARAWRHHSRRWD